MPPPMESIAKNAASVCCRAFWFGLLLTACGSPGGPTATPGAVQGPAPIATRPASPLVAESTDVATAAAQATPTPDTGTILVWWPSTLYPETNSPATDILQEQLADYPGPRRVTIRVKRADGLGGIYQTLRSGSVAAPTAMPDLVMLRRSDLTQAASGKLIEPIDPRGLAAEDLFASGLALGQVRGTQYGIPYALEIQHAVYRTSILATPPQTFDDLLRAKQPFLFAASAAKGASLTLVAQYVAAGGRLSDEKGAPVLDRAPLLGVLRFYEQALTANVADPQLLEYGAVAQYWPLFLSGKASIAQVDSTTYLAQRGSLAGVATLPLPMLSGTATIVDGWLWVVTTADPDRQAKVLDLLAWLMRADHQGRLLRALAMLPSRRSALDTWGDDPYAGFAGSLLQQPAVPPLDLVDPRVAGLLQKAFEDVLRGRKSADNAADDALKQLGGTG
jgi:ABC-type glycerol-3-phosphate transport system substrate-binding protein